MGYRSLIQCVNDLESAGHLVRLVDKVDAHLEVAEIHRRVHRSGGPAILFENVKVQKLLFKILAPSQTRPSS